MAQKRTSKWTEASKADIKLQQDNIPDLSNILHCLINILDLEETLKLLEARGGSRLYIAKNPSRSTVLKSILPIESIAKLCQLYPGETLELPKADQIHRFLRNAKISELSRSGISRATLAKRYNLSQRQISNICKSSKKSDNP